MTTKTLPDTKTSHYRIGFTWAFSGTVLWSSTALFIEYLGREYGMKPVAVGWWRTFLITLALGLIARRQNPGGEFAMNRREFGLFLLTGGIGIAIFTLLFNFSVKENGGAVATTLIFCAPVFVALLGIPILGEKVRLDQAAAITVNLLGCALVAGITDPAALIQSPAGAITGLGSGFTFAIYTLLGKAVARTARRSGMINLFYYFLFGLIILTPIGFFLEGFSLFTPVLDAWGWFLLFALSLISLGGYSFFNNSLKYLPATVSSLIQTTEPSFTAILSLVFLGRGLTLLQWIGTLMIISGVVALQLRDFRAKR